MARLGSAVRQFEDRNPEHQTKVEYIPYMIDPATASNGEPYLEYNQRRWGSDGWTVSMRRSAAPDGCAFSDWRVWPNSLLAHRLMEYAAERGVAQQVKDAVFHAIYEAGGNVSDLETLVSLGAEAGLQPDEVRRYLQSDAGEKEVLAKDRRAKREMGITGVPCFLVGGADRGQELSQLQGAVSSQKLLQALEMAAARASSS